MQDTVMKYFIVEQKTIVEYNIILYTTNQYLMYFSDHLCRL